MRPKILSKRTLLIVAFVGFAFFIAILLAFISKYSTQGNSVSLVKNTASLSNKEQKNVGLPVSLKIPVISVDSAIIPVGLTSDGAMDVPKDPAKVAWLNLGPRPGEIGSAVLAGHYDWINNMPAVFDNLDKLREGDKLYVEDENGITTNFVVREIRTYSKDEDATDIFTSDDNMAHLNLITCTGVWDKKQKTYSERLIVFTDKE